MEWKKNNRKLCDQVSEMVLAGFMYLWGRLLDFSISPLFRKIKSKVVFLLCSLQQAQTQK